MAAKNVKTFVLDTNVILHDASCLGNFQENNLVIPLPVLEEIDHFKRGNQMVNLNAREFVRKLDALTGSAIFNGGISLGKGKGKVRIAICQGIDKDIRAVFQEDTPDHRILSVSYQMHKDPKFKPPVILVTKDVNLRMKAKALGIQAEDYTTDKVTTAEEQYSGKDIIEDVNPDLIAAMYQPPFMLPVEKTKKHLKPVMVPNKYFIMRNGNQSVLAHLDPEMMYLKRLERVSAYSIKPRNAEQTFAIDALCNPEVPLVSLTGKAGTGKTLLALAAALEVRRQYRQIYIARPVVPLSNKDIGFLPGDVDSKLAPYMQPLWDNLKIIQDQFPETDKNHALINSMVKDQKLVIEPLSYIRGRSLQRVFFIVDEAQNLTPHEIKTIITRAGEGVKLVFTGDIYQIDHPYLDSQSNGLSYLIEHFKGQKLYAHINLEKGERSELAELASNLL